MFAFMSEFFLKIKRFTDFKNLKFVSFGYKMKFKVAPATFFSQIWLNLTYLAHYIGHGKP